MSKKNEKKFNESLKEIGITPQDVRLLSLDAVNTYKMVFEQVLLLMIYTRQLFIEEPQDRYQSTDNYGEHIKQRLKLLGLLFDESEKKDEIKVLQEDILELLEKDVGSNDIILALNEKNTDVSKKILSEIQNRRISFAEMISYRRRNKNYSYYQMYVSCQKSIALFQSLLRQEIYTEYEIEKQLCAEVEKLDINKESDKKSRKNKVLGGVRAHITKEIADWATKIFMEISYPSYQDNQSFNYIKVDKGYSVDDKNTDKYNLTIDRDLANFLYKINQLDDLFVNLKKAFYAKLESTTYTSEKFLKNENALKEISDWYVRYNTGLLSRTDSIPKAVVSIIDFDIKYNVPGIQEALSYAEKLQQLYPKNEGIRATPIKDLNEKITYIISTYLYGDFVKDTSYIDSFNRPLLTLDEFLLRVKEEDIKSLHTENSIPPVPRTNPETELRQYSNEHILGLLPNKIMKDWTIFSENDDGTLSAEFDEDKQKSMMNRFKPIPIFFKPKKVEKQSNPSSKEKEFEYQYEYDLNRINNMINNQYGTYDAKPFPYRSNFPYPLWLGAISKNSEYD